MSVTSSIPGHGREPLQSSRLRHVSMGTSITESISEAMGETDQHVSVAAVNGASTPSNIPFQKLCSLGTYDGGVGISNALVDFSAFPSGMVKPGSLIQIAALDASTVATELDSLGEKGSADETKESSCEASESISLEASTRLASRTDLRRRHLFLVDKMPSDMASKNPGIQVRMG